MSEHIFYLERNDQFWEIKRYSETTLVRAGKIGKHGRKFGEKTHETITKAKQFAMRQVNAKIIQGFQDPNAEVPITPMLKRRSTRLKTVNISSQPSCSRDTHIDKDKMKDTNNDTNNFHNQLKREDTLDVNELHTSIRTWRKPPRKQSTIRRQAKRESVLKKYNTSTKTSLTKKSTVLIKKPPKKQATIRRRAQISNTKKLTGNIKSKLSALSRQSTLLIDGQNSLPRLERRHTSWKNPKRFGPDKSIPILPLVSIKLD